MFAGGNYGGFGKRMRQLSQRDCYYTPSRRRGSSHSKPTNGGKPVIDPDRCLKKLDIARVRHSAPRRLRHLVEAQAGYVSQNMRLRRAALAGALFGIFGGAIALFATGTAPKSGYWTTDGLIIAFLLAITGAIIGYFSKR